MKTKKKIIVAITFIILLAMGGTLLYSLNRNSTSTSENTTSSNDATNPEGSINYDPPTPSELQETSENKEKILTQIEQPEQSQSTVTPTIVDAGLYDNTVEVRSFIPGIIENGGTCTYEFTKDSLLVEKKTKAIADATTTRCENLTFDKEELRPGTWSVLVTYTSLQTTGSSTPREIIIR